MMYSRVLLDRLVNGEQYLEKKYLNFLINPYLKVLNLKDRDDSCDPTVIIERLRVVGDSITFINMEDPQYGEDKMIEIINCVPHVEELHLSLTDSTDRVLKVIGRNCKQLLVLDLRCNEITIDGLQGLCVKRKKNGDFKPNMLLKKLYIDLDCSESIMFCLKNFPNLEVLDHEDLISTIYKEHKEQFRRGDLQNQPKYKLTKLDIDIDESELRYELTDVLLVCAMLCPNVTVLDVHDLSTPYSVIACSNFTQLQDVELTAERLHPQDFTPFIIARGAVLTSLELSHGTVSLDMLTKCCKNLESLYLAAIKIDSSSSDEATVFSKLTSITLRRYKFLEDEVEPIILLVKASPKTEVLCFPDCQYMTDQFMSTLLACRCMASIKKMNVSSTGLTEAFVRTFIFSLPSLEKINIGYGYMTRFEYENFVREQGALRVNMVL